MSKPQLVPSDVNRMECLVLLVVLRRIRNAILSGEPSGLVIDQAIEETFKLATQ